MTEEKRRVLAEVDRMREEILSLVRDELVNVGYGNLLASGVILTGGSAILEGVPELTEQIFNLPVRRGTPVGIGGLVDLVNSPIYATGVGLVLYGSCHMGKSRFQVGEGNVFSKVIHRMKEWVGEFF